FSFHRCLSPNRSGSCRKLPNSVMAISPSLSHEPHAVIAGRSVGCCAEVETVGHNNSDAAENDRRRQIHEIIGEAAVWAARRGLQHVRAASAARPGHAHVVVLTLELRDAED